MHRDHLGKLEERVTQIAAPPPPELAAFSAALPDARETGNDLIHALRVQTGLPRKVTTPKAYTREFYTGASLLTRQPLRC